MRRERSAVVTRLVLAVALASVAAVVGRPMPEAGAAAGVPLRRCAPEGYGLEQMLAQPVQAGQAVRLTAGWLTAMEKRRSCLLQTTIRLTITGSSEVAATAEWTVKSVRRPWSGIVHTWVWRNWCESEQGKATVEFSAPDERVTRQSISNPPACVSPGAPSTVTDLGTGTKHVKREQRFPPHILPKRAPPALHHEVLAVKNAWLVSDGYTLVAVYAGSPGIDPSIGRFGIIRQNAIFGVQYEPPDLVDVGRVGALKITRAPRGRSRETTAQYGRLNFVAANGTKGVIELTGDRVRITTRPPPGG
jgi:hypothetical protein